MTDPRWLLDRLLSERFGWPSWFMRPPRDDDDNDDEGEEDNDGEVPSR